MEIDITPAGPTRGFAGNRFRLSYPDTMSRIDAATRFRAMFPYIERMAKRVLPDHFLELYEDDGVLILVLKTGINEQRRHEKRKLFGWISLCDIDLDES